MIEKLEACPRCHQDGDNWAYDAQTCRDCVSEWRETMRAEQAPYVYDGPICDGHRPQWVGSAEGDKDGPGEIGAEITLDANLFPPGSIVIVREPVCPRCRMVPDRHDDGWRCDCDCDFDWHAYAANRFS